MAIISNMNYPDRFFAMNESFAIFCSYDGIYYVPILVYWGQDMDLEIRLRSSGGFMSLGSSQLSVRAQV